MGDIMVVLLPYPPSANPDKRKVFIWSESDTQFLAENYPLKGKKWCADALGLKEHQIRSKASFMGLKARGISDAWQQAIKDRSKTITGRKRPEQAEVMRKAIVEKGLHILNEKTKKIVSDKAKARLKEQGHPRGMLGKFHTEEAKEKMSLSGQTRAKRESAEVIEDRTMKGVKTRAENGTLATGRVGCTWKSGWRDIGGTNKYYRSKWEANYARYLEWLKSKGEIIDWKHEPETFWFDGIKRGCVSYLPDFRVTERNGSISYHEVKGWMDDRSKTKITRMAKYHPLVRLIVIEAKAYRAISKTMSPIIRGWE